MVCKYRADFLTVYLTFLIFVLTTKYNWQKQRNLSNKSAVCKRIPVRNCISRRNHQYLGDDDLIIIKMIMIIDKILMKCLGRFPPLVHCFFDGEYDSTREWRSPLFQPPTTNKPWRNIKSCYKFWNQTCSPLEVVNLVQAWRRLAPRRSGRESR